MHHFSAIISKVQEFVQNRMFSPRSARFLIVALGTPLISDFPQSAGIWCKTTFLVRDQDVLSFSHWAHHFLAIFSKVHKFVQNRSFHPEISTFCNFCIGRNTFLAVFRKVYEFSQNSVFSPRSACFVIFALGELLFSDFQQSAQVCPKKRFQPKITMFSFSYWAQYLLATFSKVHEFVQNRTF